MNAELVEMVKVRFRGRYELLSREEASALRDSLGNALGSYASTINAIISTVCEFYQIQEGAIYGPARTGRAVLARHVAMYLCRRLTIKSLNEIGAHFNRDHGTICHAVNSVTSRMQTNPKVKSEVESMEFNLQSSTTIHTKELKAA